MIEEKVEEKEFSVEEKIENILRDCVNDIAINSVYYPDDKFNNDAMYELRRYYMNNEPASSITSQIRAELGANLIIEHSQIGKKIREDRNAVRDMFLVSTGALAFSPLINSYLPAIFFAGMGAIYKYMTMRRKRAFEKGYENIMEFNDLLKDSKTWDTILDKLKPEIEDLIEKAYDDEPILQYEHI
ncbi:MAG: hypothetical protein ABIB43_05190 [archaeon]